MELPIAVLRRYAELARHDRTEYLGPNHDTVSSDSMVAYRPVGVVSVITAYNYPILLALRSVGGALAAGCTVVLAPSPKTPLTALMLARVAEEAGFPPGVVTSSSATPRWAGGSRRIRQWTRSRSPAHGRSVR